MQLLLADARTWTAKCGELPRRGSTISSYVAAYGARGVTDSLQVLVKQADLDKGRRNDGLSSEELRQPRRRVRCPLPCVASAATSHAPFYPTPK